MADAPHNLDFERALLAAIIVDNAAIDQVGSFDADGFFDAVHREMFNAMLDLRRSGRAINVVTLGSLMGTDPLGGDSILDSLKAVEFANVGPKPHELAEELTDLAMRRAMLAQGEWLLQQAASRHAKRFDILAIHLREIDALIAKGRPQGRTMWDMADAMSAAQELFQRGESRDRITTGLASLNKVTGGFATRMPVWMAMMLNPPARPAPAFTPDVTGGDIEPLVRFVASSTQGQRNNRLHWAACRAGEMAARGQVSAQSAGRRLLAAAAGAGYAGAEVTRTINSGFEESGLSFKP
jgi:hypothetical protein